LLEGIEPPSWNLADQVIEAGHCGILFQRTAEVDMRERCGIDAGSVVHTKARSIATAADVAAGSAGTRSASPCAPLRWWRRRRQWFLR